MNQHNKDICIRYELDTHYIKRFKLYKLPCEGALNKALPWDAKCSDPDQCSIHIYGDPFADPVVHGLENPELNKKQTKEAYIELDRIRNAPCPFCGHRIGQHDPEDRQCDAHANDRLGVCKCPHGQDVVEILIAARSVMC